MKRILLIAALLAAFPCPVLSETKWAYIIDGENGTLWFGGNVRQYAGKTFIDLYTEEDPEGENGPENSWTQAYDCSNKTVNEDGKHVAIKEDTINQSILEYICE